MPYSDTNVNKLIVNVLTKQQYDNIQNPDQSELYFITDDNTSIPVTSVNGDIGAIVVDKIKTTAISDNAEYNLLGTASNNTNISAVTAYQQTPLSFSKTSSLSRLAIGQTDLPGHIRLYSDVTNATGYTDLKSGTTSTNTRTITFPDATGTVALTSDIPTNISDFSNDAGYLTTETDPTVPAWAKASNKPTYTASEVGALPDTTKIAYQGTISLSGTTATLSGIPINALYWSVRNNNGTGLHCIYVHKSGDDAYIYRVTGYNYSSGDVQFDLTCCAGSIVYHISTNTYSADSTSTSMTGTYSTRSIPTSYVSSFNGNTGAITYTAPTYSLSMSGNRITLTPSSGTATYVDLPVYNGGVE